MMEIALGLAVLVLGAALILVIIRGERERKLLIDSIVALKSPEALLTRQAVNEAEEPEEGASVRYMGDKEMYELQEAGRGT